MVGAHGCLRGLKGMYTRNAEHTLMANVTHEAQNVGLLEVLETSLRVLWIV